MNLKKTRDIGEYLDIKNLVCKKRIFDKLMLTCQDDIGNTSETTLITLFNKKVT